MKLDKTKQSDGPLPKTLYEDVISKCESL